MQEEENGLIVIDPGHGGLDNGAAYGYVDEDDTNLIISFLLRAELTVLGYESLLTRDRDESVSLRNRCDFANQAGADLFVSIHCDAFHKTTTSGMSVHMHPNGSRRARMLADRIARSLVENFPGHRQRGVRENNFAVLRWTWMPAVLIECEFLSNPETRDFLHEPENQLALARAIAGAVSEFRRHDAH